MSAMPRPMRRCVRSPVFLAVLWVASAASFAQEKSVRPGINKPFESPNVKEFEGKFERDGREPFDHREKIVAACGIEAGMSVADVGAGTGLFSRLFAKQVGEKGRVFAVDISDEFIEHIAKTAKEANLTNIQGVVCPPDSVNLSECSVDLVFLCDTYHHFEFPYKTVSSIHDALKPGGRLILIDFRRIDGTSSEWTLSHVRAGQEVFEKEILECGFKKACEIEGVLKENYMVVFEKPLSE
ncbi:MAG: methyltransferase domain-containing protein [Planctomycetes bacterium]|nr:methyltransferase domain-containing protein [Planctomycetota bacterium]